MFLADGKSGAGLGTEEQKNGTNQVPQVQNQVPGQVPQYFVNAKNIVIIVFYDNFERQFSTTSAKDVIYYIKIGSNGSMESAITMAQYATKKEIYQKACIG